MGGNPLRGVAFFATGSSAFDFYGGDRHGDKLFASSLVALNAALPAPCQTQ